MATYELRIASNGAKLFYHNNQKIARSQLPNLIVKKLLKQLEPPVRTHFNELPMDLKRELSLYFDDEMFQTLNWDHFLSNKYFLVKKAYNVTLIPHEILLAEDIKNLQFLIKNPLNRNKLLYNAATYGNLEQLKLMLKNNGKELCCFEELNNGIDFGGTFANAIAHGQLDIVKWLICQAYVNVHNGLKLSLAYKYYDIAEFLLTEYKIQIDINEILEKIIATNSIKLLSKVIENFPVNLNSILYIAAGLSTVEIVSYMINSGAMNITSALCNAMSSKNVAIVTHLTKYIEK